MQISFTKRKIQYLYLAIIVVSLLLGGVSYARAQETPPAENREQAVSTSGETEQGLTQEQQDRFINLVRNVYTRMDAAAARLLDISVRIDERIVKLNAEGINTSEALVPFEQAKARLSTVKSSLEAAKKGAEESIVSDTPRESFKIARTEFNNVRDALRESFLLLRETVNALRDAVTEAELSAGSKATTSDAVTSEAEPTN